MKLRLNLNNVHNLADHATKKYVFYIYVYINSEMDVEVAMSYFKWLFQNLPGRTEENHKNFRQYSQF